MKQLVQNFKTGKLEVLDIPAPKGFAEYNFDRSKASVISSGTERSLVELAQSSFLEK
jgi:hypothetical protein